MEDIHSPARIRQGVRKTSMTNRVFNFSPGPATLPLPVLQRAQEELLDFNGMGASILEVSHRSPEFMALHQETLDLARAILEIPDNYRILVAHGGAHMQFSAIPMNLIATKPARKAIYTVTGNFAKRAWQEAQKYGDISVLYDTSDTRYNHLPPITKDMVDPAASYLYIVTNNTVEGTQWHRFPETGDVPLVGDATSDIFSRPMDLSRFGLLYAAGQKNLGPAGMAMVIVREDLIGHALPETPIMADYEVMAKDNSLTNTLNTFGVYLMNLMLKWTREMGGLREMDAYNRKKCAVLYDLLDASGFYTSTVNREHRSLMNVVFDLPSDELTSRFLAEAKAENMISLKGHKARGGIRASIYNAMPMEGVTTLARFMEEFERKNG